MIATRNYDILNTGIVDLLGKYVTCIYSDVKKSQWSLLAVIVSYSRCFVRMLPANQLLAHFTALFQ